MTDRAKSILTLADAYSSAAKCLNTICLNNTKLFTPSQVTAALALELYFKSLYYLIYSKDFKKNHRHSHDFHDLFCTLPTKIQKSMESDFNQTIKKRNMNDVKKIESESGSVIPPDLKGNLKPWSSVFVEIRYIYDVSNKSIPMMFFPEIEETIKNQIFSIRPDLKF